MGKGKLSKGEKWLITDTQIEQRDLASQALIDILQAYALEDENKENKICCVFGCGERLTFEQTLYGGKCVKHSGKFSPTVK